MEHLTEQHRSLVESQLELIQSRLHLLKENAQTQVQRYLQRPIAHGTYMQQQDIGGYGK